MDNGAGGRQEVWLARSQLKGQGDVPLKAFLKRLRTCAAPNRALQLPPALRCAAVPPLPS